MMQFYTQQHQFYFGVDLHAKTLHACVVDADLKLIEAYDAQIARLDLEWTRKAKVTNPQLFYRLTSIPGIGPILALTMVHEVESIERFPSVGHFDHAPSPYPLVAR